MDIMQAMTWKILAIKNQDRIGSNCKNYLNSWQVAGDSSTPFLVNKLFILRYASLTDCREIPQYGAKLWQPYFARTFEVYTRLWKFQQEHRQVTTYAKTLSLKLKIDLLASQSFFNAFKNLSVARIVMVWKWHSVSVLGWDKIKASAVPPHKTSMKSSMPVCQSTLQIEKCYLQWTFSLSL